MSSECEETGEDTGLGALGASEAPNIYLNTLGACFFCLKAPSGIGDISGFSDMSLREVFCYLEISGLKKKMRVVQAAEGNTGGDSHKKEECDFEVRLCEKCADETKDLSDLMNVFQEIQNEIDNGLRRIRGILKGSKTEMGIQQLVKIRNANPDQACLLQQLREEIDKKCFEKLNGVPPGVKEMISFGVPEPVATRSTFTGLTTTPRATTSFTAPFSMSLRSASTSSMEIKSKMPISTNPLNGEQSMFSATPQPRQNIRQPSDDESLEIFAEHFHDNIQNRKKIKKCLHCNMVCRMTTNIRMHLVAKHLEFLFPKITAINGKVLGKTLSDVLWSEIKCNGDSNKSNTDGALPLKCGICKRGFVEKKWCRYHLVVQHYPELVDKLKMSLGGENSKRMSNGSAGGGEENQGPTKGGLQRHACPERRGKYKCTIWGGGCGVSFSNLQTLQIHQLSCVKKKKRREASTSSTPSLQGGGVGKPLLTTSTIVMKPQQMEYPTVNTEAGLPSWTSGVGDGRQDQMNESSEEPPVENVHQDVESSYGGNEMGEGGNTFGEAGENDTSDMEMEEYIDVVTCSGDEDY